MQTRKGRHAAVEHHPKGARKANEDGSTAGSSRHKDVSGGASVIGFTLTFFWQASSKTQLEVHLHLHSTQGAVAPVINVYIANGTFCSAGPKALNEASGGGMNEARRAKGKGRAVDEWFQQEWDELNE